MYKRFFYIHIAIIILSLQSINAQSFGLKTSTTMWMTATPNMEVNFPIGRKITAHLPVLYNPFVFKQNTRIQQLTTMPGIRFWKQEEYIKQFISVYGIASRYHLGGMFNMKYRYSGNAYGAGVGVGYSWLLSNRLNLEAELGAGVVYSTYDKFGWEKKSRYYGKYNGIFLIPTKIDLNLIYLF